MMRKIYICLLILVLCTSMLMLSACNNTTKKPVETTVTTPNEEVNPGTPGGNEEQDMKNIMINGNKLSDFMIVTESANDPAGSSLKSKLRKIFGYPPVHISEASIPLYKDTPYIRIFTVAPNVIQDTIQKTEVRFYEQNGNFMILLGSPILSEQTAVEYFFEQILKTETDLTGYNKVVSLEVEDVLKNATQAADQKASVILKKENTYSSADVTGNGKCYYVSYSEGEDSNDGLSPESAWKTVEKVSQASLPAGSVVLFKRGDEWRMDSYAQSNKSTYLLLQSNVIYSSYGEGEKPIINGSPVDAAKIGTWTLTSTPNVWRYSRPYVGMSNTAYNDVGNIFFNGGEAYGYKMLLKETGIPFEGIADLDKEYEFWYNTEDNCVYLYCEQNPAEKYESIEMGVRLNLVRVTTAQNIVFDNFTIKNGAAHGVSLALAENVKITNCEIGWIGGGVYDHSSAAPARYGNGVEINRDCRNIVVDQNYIYQCYDAGVTHQFDGDSSTTCFQEDIAYTNNILEYCFYNLEYFVSPAKSYPNAVRYMKNILISNNYMLYAGYGWGYWRPANGQPGAAHIKGWNLPDQVVVDGTMKTENNVFVLSRGDMICAANIDSPQDVAAYNNNTFMQRKGYVDSNGSVKSFYMNRGVVIGTEQVAVGDRDGWKEAIVKANVYLKDKGNQFYTLA